MCGLHGLKQRPEVTSSYADVTPNYAKVKPNYPPSIYNE